MYTKTLAANIINNDGWLNATWSIRQICLPSLFELNILYPTECLSLCNGVGGGEKRQGGKRQKLKKQKLPVYRHDYLYIKSKKNLQKVTGTNMWVGQTLRI